MRWPWPSAQRSTRDPAFAAKAMTAPLVSFVVPCYKLAHFLVDCVDSILGQTHSRVEVIVMDDHSPDDTATVVERYKDDARVRYVRNDPNLGHLRNYNKGIGLATGEYIWLISADDKLRAADAVERYVKLMEANPKLAYAFCPAVELTAKGEELNVVDWTKPYTEGRILPGREFLLELAQGNCVSAPAVMVRRRCYEEAGAFPLDLPHAGDWYLWCAFATLGDVAYVADPLIYYRVHGTNMSLNLRDTRMALVRADQSQVRWRLKEMADRAGFAEVSRQCLTRIAHRWAVDLAEGDPVPAPQEIRGTVAALPENHLRPGERAGFLASLLRQAADQLFEHGNLEGAKAYYRAALADDPWLMIDRAKLLLVLLGPPGVALRKSLRTSRPTKAAQ
jgi:glycosyltransferase involved in cell wall biosynthesis